MAQAETGGALDGLSIDVKRHPQVTVYLNRGFDAAINSSDPTTDVRAQPSRLEDRRQAPVDYPIKSLTLVQMGQFSTLQVSHTGRPAYFLGSERLY